MRHDSIVHKASDKTKETKETKAQEDPMHKKYTKKAFGLHPKAFDYP